MSQDRTTAGFSATTDEVLDHLPLRPVVFSILIALSDTARHGHSIMEWTNERMGGRAILGPGTLYRVLKELKEAMLIEHTDESAEADQDGRRQYYRLTELGRRVAVAETHRMHEMVHLEQARALLSDGLGG